MIRNPAPKRSLFPAESPDDQLRDDAAYAGQRALWLMRHPYTGMQSGSWNNNMQRHVVETARIAFRYADAFLRLAESRERLPTPGEETAEQ